MTIENGDYQSHCCGSEVVGEIVDGWGFCRECGDHCEALSEEEIEEREGPKRTMKEWDELDAAEAKARNKEPLTIIEALQAALADGMFYCSNSLSCDRSIEEEIASWRAYEESLAVKFTTNYEYRDGVIRFHGGDVYLCQTADEVHAEREADE